MGANDPNEKGGAMNFETGLHPVINAFRRLEGWWRSLWRPAGRIWMRCGVCGRSFWAGPEHLVELGVVAEEYAEAADGSTAEELVEVIDSEAALRERFGVDDLALTEMESAEPGDLIETGTEHWCDACLEEAFLEQSLIADR